MVFSVVAMGIVGDTSGRGVGGCDSNAYWCGSTDFGGGSGEVGLKVGKTGSNKWTIAYSGG